MDNYTSRVVTVLRAIADELEAGDAGLLSLVCEPENCRVARNEAHVQRRSTAQATITWEVRRI